MQYATHVPNGDFIKFFKKLLSLPNARDYFPKLILKGGQINYVNSNSTLSVFEDNCSTEKLMNYLNPTLNEIENQELICAARFVHWAMNDPEHRTIQVETAIEHFKANMIDYAKPFNLNRVPAKVCQVICDIHHQGRSSNDRIAAALNINGEYEKAHANLLTIGAANYSQRITSVKNTIAALVKQGLFDKKYDTAKNNFM